MKTTLQAVGGIMIIALLATGCGNGTPAATKEAAAQEPVDENRITLEAEKMHGVKIGQQSMINIADKLQVPSQVEVDEHRLVRVGANVAGRIVDVYATLGDSVEAGAELARISSPELTQAQLAYLRAFSLTTLAEKAAER